MPADTILPERVDRFWLYQVNPENEHGLVFKDRRGREHQTTLAGLRRTLHDKRIQDWDIEKYKRQVKPGDLVLVRVTGKTAVGGAAVLRVQSVDAPRGGVGTIRMENVEELSDSLLDSPLEDEWLLATLRLPAYRGRVHPITHAYRDIRKELLRRAQPPPSNGGIAISVARTFDPKRVPKPPRPAERLDPISRADALGKAVEGHHQLLVALHHRLVELGVPADDIEEDAHGFDLRARGTIFEAKTTTTTNMHDQVRLGLAQLLDYRLVAGPEDASLCLVIDRPLTSRQKKLLDSIEVDCLALSTGKWILQTQTREPLAHRIAGEPSAASILARHRRKEPPPSEAKTPLAIDVSCPVVVLQTDAEAARVEQIVFIVAHAWLNGGLLGRENEILAFLGPDVPHHRGFGTWVAFPERTPTGFIEAVTAAIADDGTTVERELGQLSKELRFVAPLARATHSDGLERLVLEARRGEYPKVIDVAPAVDASSTPVRAMVRGVTLNAVVTERGG